MFKNVWSVNNLASEKKINLNNHLFVFISSLFSEKLCEKSGKFYWVISSWNIEYRIKCQISIKYTLLLQTNLAHLQV